MEPRTPFAIPDFRFYWIARLASTIGQMAMVIVIGWQVYDVARDTMGMSIREAALQLGLIGLVQFIPLFVLTLVTGWTADRVDRRFIAAATIGLELFCAATLALFTWLDATTLLELFVIAALLGVARAFAAPALSALAPNLVPPRLLPRAIAMSSMSWQAGGIAGPAVGGYLYAIEPEAPYIASALLFTVSLACVLLIRPIERTVMDGSQNPWRQMVDGLHYVRRNRLVLGAISLDLFAVLLGGATAMLPIYARDILHTGPTGLGHLRAAPALGATLTAIWFSFRPLSHNVGAKMMAAVGVFGAATALFGLSRNIYLSLALLSLIGAADMFSVYVRQSLIQLHTPNEMRGRVGAVATLFVSASNELGEARSGFLAALIGPVVAVVAGGVGAVGVTLLWLKWFPQLHRARTFDPPDRT